MVKTRRNGSSPLRHLSWLLFLSLLLAGCHDDDDDDDDGGGGQSPPAQEDSVTLTGRVSNGNPLGAVTVTVAGVSTTTDDDGFFLLEEVPVEDDQTRLLVTFSRDGFAPTQEAVPLGEDDLYTVEARLLRYDLSESRDPTRDQTLEVTGGGGESLVMLDVPANSLAGAAAGDATFQVAYGDPTTEEGMAAFPGDFVASEDDDGEPEVLLESFVFTEISIQDADGSEITELTSPTQVRLRLPDAFQTGGQRAGEFLVGDSIPWWSYDEEDGIWVREDADPATEELDDADIVTDGTDLYALAMVTHLSWWNVDAPVREHACLTVTVVDGDGQPLRGMEVMAQGVTYNGASQPARTDADGQANVTVKRSSDAIIERVTLAAEFGGISFPYDVTDATVGLVQEDEIYSPTTPGSTIDGSGQCLELPNPITVSLDGRITGTVTQVDGRPAAGLTVYTDYGFRAETDDQGRFTLEAPVGIPVTVFVPGTQAQEATVEAENLPVDLTFDLPNLRPEIAAIDRDPAGTVEPGASVTLSTSASDPEGSSVTLDWEASAGTLNTTTGNSVVWQAPAGGSGRATVTVTARDARGATAGRATTLTWAPPGGSGGLTFTLLTGNEEGEELPFTDGYVILHGQDDVSVDQVRQTDADGMVDFGAVGDGPVTVTLAADPENSGGLLGRQLITLVDIEPDDYVLLVDFIGEFGDGSCDDPWTFSATFSGVPAMASGGDLFPASGETDSISGETITFTDAEVCDSALQEDGALSLLATVQAFNQATGRLNIVRYGFLLDQPLQDSYIGALDRLPEELTWQTNDPDLPLNSLQISGFRDDGFYSLGGYLDFQETGSGSGTLAAVTDFPVDYYQINGYRESGTTVQLGWQLLEVLPGVLNVPVPDYVFQNKVYNNETETFAWELTGDSSRDIQELLIGSSDESDFTGQAYWEVYMPPERRTFTLPQLPDPVNDWFNRSTLESATVSALDSDQVEDYRSAIRVLGDGGLFPDEGNGRFLEGFDEFELEADIMATRTVDGMPREVRRQPQDWTIFRIRRF